MVCLFCVLRAINVFEMVLFTDMFGPDADRCTVFEALLGTCQKGICQVQSGIAACV